MKNISGIVKKIEPSVTLRIDALYKQMKADGIDVIGFGAGEPDFNTPDNIKAAAMQAIEGNRTRYTPAGGIYELRKAIAARLLADCDVNYLPEQIVTASGAKHSIFVAFQVLLNPGDNVILPSPYWNTYAQSIKMAHAVPRIVRTAEEDGFKLNPKQLDDAVTDKTKMLIVCNPSNPTGMMYTRDELLALAEVCVKHDLYILSDEVYYRFIYDGRKFTSMASLGDDIYKRTIIINGVSKAYAMTGWRIGYTASDLYIARNIENYLSHSTSAPCTVSQYAAVEALTGPQESVCKMRDVFEQRRDYIVSRINAMDAVSCIKPQGAFYIMVNIGKLIGKTLCGRLINNCDDFALALLEEGMVAAVPCTDFGCDNYIRLTYAASMETIKEGMDRMEKFLQEGNIPC